MKGLLIAFYISIFASGSFAQTGWQVLPNSPIAPLWNHDDIEFYNEDIGWLCNISGEIWKTEDGGDSWTMVENRPGTSFRCLAFVDSLNGFVGNLGLDAWHNTTDSTLMYRTTDGGLTWTAVTNIPDSLSPEGVCGLQAIDDQHVYGVGRYDEPAIFYKTTDAGATWQTKNLLPLADHAVDIYFFDPDTGIIAGGLNSQCVLLYTTDGGQNFINVASSPGDHVWKIFFRDRMNGYAQITDYSTQPKKYLYTTDGGLTWTENLYKDSNGDYEGLGVGFFDENLGWLGGDLKTYETTDGGATFTEMSIDTSYDDYLNRMYRINDECLYAVGSRVYKWSSSPVGARTIPYVDNTKCKIKCNPNPLPQPLR